MESSEKEAAARELLQAFMLFNRQNWRHHRTGSGKFSEMQVLMCVKFKSKGDPNEIGLKVSDISRILKVTSPTVTQLINGLEAGGLVARKEDPEDRRAVRITLTEEGEKTAQREISAFTDRMAGLVNYLGNEESKQLTMLLKKAGMYFKNLNESESGGDDHTC